MYRGTDNLSSFFAIGTPSAVSTNVNTVTARNSTSGNAPAQTIVPVPVSTAVGTVNEAPANQIAPTNSVINTNLPSGETTPSSTTSPMFGGASSAVVSEEKEVSTANVNQPEPKKFQMTTKHWIILAIVVISAFAIYKHFSKK